MFTSSFLIRVKRRALRQRLWFKVFSDMERGIFDLTVGVLDRVRSAELGVILVDIIRRLKRSENSVKRYIGAIGYSRDRKLVQFALAWGNKSADSWMEVGFAEFICFQLAGLGSRDLGVLYVSLHGVG